MKLLSSFSVQAVCTSFELFLHLVQIERVFLIVQVDPCVSLCSSDQTSTSFSGCSIFQSNAYGFKITFSHPGIKTITYWNSKQISFSGCKPLLKTSKTERLGGREQSNGRIPFCVGVREASPSLCVTLICSRAVSTVL